MKQSVCALVSGGLDSCVLLGELSRQYRRVYPLFVRQGLVWEETELRHLRRFLEAARTIKPEPLTVLSLPMRHVYGHHWSVTGRHVPGAATPDKAVYLPGRNLLLLSAAAVFGAGRRIRTVALGSLGHNPFPDATPNFFLNFSRSASQALNVKFRVIAPFRRLTKQQVILRGVRLGVPLHLSFSCLQPYQGVHCGRCNKCAERRRAFRDAKVEDRTKYRQ